MQKQLHVAALLRATTSGRPYHKARKESDKKCHDTSQVNFLHRGRYGYDAAIG